MTLKVVCFDPSLGLVFFVPLKLTVDIYLSPLIAPDYYLSTSKFIAPARLKFIAPARLKHFINFERDLTICFSITIFPGGKGGITPARIDFK